MRTGLEMLHELKQLASDVELGGVIWIDVVQKLDLCKLTVTELLTEGIEEGKARQVVDALYRQDVAPIGQALGINLRVKFRVTSSRNGLNCFVRVDHADNAEWLRSYLTAALPDALVSAVAPVVNASAFVVKIACGANSPPWRLQRTLIDCPAIVVTAAFTVRVHERPNHRIQAWNLASWIDRQGERTWWSVDGDPLLTSLVDFPCPPDELSAELRRINKPLLVADPRDCGSGEEIVAEDVDRFSYAVTGRRQLFVTWEGGLDDWLLIEDEPLIEVNEPRSE